MTTSCPQRFARSVLLLAVTIAVLPVASAWAQSAPCAGGGAPQLTCTFVDDVAPYDAFLELACTRNLMAGCGGAYTCPGEAVLREDMAVHLERLYRGHTFTPTTACASQCTFVPVPEILAGRIPEILAAFRKEAASDRQRAGGTWGAGRQRGCGALPWSCRVV